MNQPKPDLTAFVIEHTDSGHILLNGKDCTRLVQALEQQIEALDLSLGDGLVLLSHFLAVQAATHDAGLPGAHCAEVVISTFSQAYKRHLLESLIGKRVPAAAQSSSMH